MRGAAVRESNENRIDRSTAESVVQIGKADTVTVLTGGARPPTSVPAPEPVPIRVRDADPVRLGVHRPIRITERDAPSMPGYVPRDFDAREPAGLRPLIDAAADSGGFVLLVGGSSVGKTRSLYEAVRTRLPDWWLLHPAHQDQLAGAAASSPQQLVIWLDELQKYLDGERGLTAATVRELLRPGRRVLLVGTLWPRRYDEYVEQPRETNGKADDPYRVERELLKLADVLYVGPSFSAMERERAEQAAKGDERLRLALASPDFGLTQVIAGAPQLVHRWDAADAYARALLTAAVDAALLGAKSGIPGDLLRTAVPGYCTPEERASAPDDWFDRALAYASRPLLGAASPLIPVRTDLGMGSPDAYRAADYLVQHVGRERRSTPPPQSFWDACRDHLTDTADVAGLGAAAVARQRLAAGLPLLRRAADAGDVTAMRRVAEVSRGTGDVESEREMRGRLAASGDPDAGLQQVLLAEWDFDEILALAEAGNRYAVAHLIEYGDPHLAVSLLREHMEPGNDGAWYRLARLLSEEEDRNEEAIAILEGLLGGDREGKDPDEDVLLFLAELLAQEGRAERLYELTGEGHSGAARSLAALLERRGETAAALDVLRDFADQGDLETDDLLAHMLAERGHLDELLVRAETDPRCAVAAAKLLEERGDPDAAVRLLCPYADGGDVYASSQLAELLGALGREDELRARMAAGDEWATAGLALAALDRGDLDEAIRLDGLCLYPSLHREIGTALETMGRVDQAVEYLTAEEEKAGEWIYPHQINDLLKRHGRADALRARIDRGDASATDCLIELLIEQGRTEEAKNLRRHGLTADGSPARAD